MCLITAVFSTLTWQAIMPIHSLEESGHVNRLNSTLLPVKDKCILIKRYTSCYTLQPLCYKWALVYTPDSSQRGCVENSFGLQVMSLCSFFALYWSHSVSCWFTAPLFSRSQAPAGIRTTGTLAHKLNSKQDPLLGTRQGAKPMVHNQCSYGVKQDWTMSCWK